MQFSPLRIHIDTLDSALAILTSMITPAILLSACGTFILSTSNRQNRIVDRVRSLTEQFENAVELHQGSPVFEERRVALYGHLDQLTMRAELLQRSLTALYLASGLFVATSVAIGFVSLASSALNWLPVVLGLLGACCLFAATILLIRDARLAIQLLREETAFLLKLYRTKAQKNSNPQ